MTLSAIDYVRGQGALLGRSRPVSLLDAVGVPDLITTDIEEYQAVALKLARDPALLAEPGLSLCAIAILTDY